jgi:hypothetical protein
LAFAGIEPGSLQQAALEQALHHRKQRAQRDRQ